MLRTMLDLRATAQLALLLYPISVFAQSSCSALSPGDGIRPTVASGYQMQVVATGLNDPRGILLDRNGNLLVVEQGRGVISAHTLNENNGCVTVGESTDVTGAIDLNHGIEISEDGNTLYASTNRDAYAWDYDTSARTVSNQRTLVSNMEGSDHSTRTLLLSRTVPGMLVIARGSTSNIDLQAADIDSGISQVKAFNLNNRTDAYDYTSDGLLLGWGLRNEVGLAEHPISGGIYGVENSADQIERLGVDVHEENPAEELNFLGYLNGTENDNQGSNFGYPWCFSTWVTDDLPNNSDLPVGSQFAIDGTTASENQNRTDAYCAEQTEARLVFQAHMAPLDIKFSDSGREAWVTFHGSWDRSDPVGYKMSVVAFNENGDPVDDLTSMTAATDIFMNEDNSRCPQNCMRPVGMAIDGQGRIFVSSDSSGEIYLVSRTGTNSDSASSTSSSNLGSFATPPPRSNALLAGAYLAPMVAMLL